MNAQAVETYCRALEHEIELVSRQPVMGSRPFRFVYFGGGTPSTFKPTSIGKLLAWAAATFPIANDCEITMEANPGTVDAAHFAGYHDAGVNRISVGVQSFQPKLLKFLGRVHSADEAKKALNIVKQSGFENFSFDLIYANPGQTLADLEADIDAALTFQPPHLSAYNLMFEEGTPFHHEYRAGKMAHLDEDEEIAMLELIEIKLGAAGLKRYEIPTMPAHVHSPNA
jgi:oxygen-independent coproporphyrinogen-3 oxidase